MAYDETLKAKVRAGYESQNLSYRKLHEFYSHEIPSHKTIESWAKADSAKGVPWLKNRYRNLSDAIDAVVEKGMDALHEEATSLIKNRLKEGQVVPVELVDNDAYIEALGKEEVVKVLTKKNYMEMMDSNLLEAQPIAKLSTHINVKATFQMMIKSVVETKYGKNINLNAVSSSDSFNKEELAGKSEAELIEMLNNEKD